jgi:hypothetical protein
MCNPLATGSRHASPTIRARWRGGKLLGVSRARVVGQDVPQPTVSVAAADPPDGGPIALQATGDVADAVPGGHVQDDPGVLDLEPGQATVVRDELQKWGIRVGEGQRARLSTTHEGASTKGLPSQ